MAKNVSARTLWQFALKSSLLESEIFFLLADAKQELMLLLW
ncbi:hypothetical protein [Kamptonema formosum]|nr:hypothetical protein [Oscillatoria sp. PCC 10802]